MRKIIRLMMVVSLFTLSACAGREAEPVQVMHNDDAKKSCAYLVNEIEVKEFEIQQLLPETKKNKTMKNVGLGIAGFYTFFIPWILIDFSNPEAKEYEALQARHAHLVGIATTKECEFMAQDFPALNEIKKDYDLRGALKKENTVQTNQ